MIDCDDQRALLDPRTRLLWLGVREGLLLIVGAIETYLGMQRRYPGETKKQTRG